MAKISAKQVKELRERTGAGMMDCRNALNDAEGNLDEAVQILRKKGAAKAAKKAGRIAAEGLVDADVDAAGNGVIVEINCETDFVARNADFKVFVDKVEAKVVSLGGEGVNESVDEERSQLVATIGENIQVRRFELFGASSDLLNVGYVHPGGRKASMVSLKVADASKAGAAELKSLGDDLAFHVVAMDPACISPSELPAELIAAEKEVAREKHQGKPEHIFDQHILPGVIKKLEKERCLLLQEAVMADDNLSNADLVKACAKAIGTEVSVVGFAHYVLGDGIEKKEDNLADEVAKLTSGQ